MEVFNILFESGEILKQKINDIEKRNIIALEQSNREIKELLAKVPTPKKHKVIYVHDNSHYQYDSNFPVDHRIIKR
ncbi:MAG: hypothetical protein V3S80_08310, partial [Sulfurimonadaceae bacterium]